MKLAHIINVTEAASSENASYLHVAQPVTMASMLVAARIARKQLKVELLGIKHVAESVELPAGFRWTRDIDRYAWEYIPALKEDNERRPLPRLVDILQAGYASTDADYMVFSNVDIGLYPEFYLRVGELIDAGHDAFCINRVDLAKVHAGETLNKDNLELIYRAPGTPHVGIDCFVFRRDILPALELRNVFVGFPPVGQVLKDQISRNSENFIWIKNETLTFHLGSDASWLRDKSPYRRANNQQAQGLYSRSFRKPYHRRLARRLADRLKRRLSVRS